MCASYEFRTHLHGAHFFLNERNGNSFKITAASNTCATGASIYSSQADLNPLIIILEQSVICAPVEVGLKPYSTLP